MSVDSSLECLQKISRRSPEWRFNIPIYQRLYVWGNDQVKTLLEDIINAYLRGDDVFYLGGVLLVDSQSDNNLHCYDVIDGQQRFTTLWLLCLALQGNLSEFLTVEKEIGAGKGDNKPLEVPRISFSIRQRVNHFLERLTNGDKLKDIEQQPDTDAMRTALDLMESFFKQRESEHPADGTRPNKEDLITGVTKFIWEKVYFVVTRVPQETDLNKLFEVINNRGVQLQHHEILKAKMLNALKDDNHSAYAEIWDICSDMENYVDRTLKTVLGEDASKELYGLYQRNKLVSSKSVKKLLTDTEKNKSAQAQTLADILNSDCLSDVEEPEDSVNGDDDNRVRSIFGFPLLLQHVLRIWLFENNKEDLPRLNDKELLSLFDVHFFDASEDSKANAKSFIELLWEIRVLFDLYVIKWVKDGEEEHHKIAGISVSKENISRSLSTDRHQGLSLLQSMLYHSQELTTQYWVTPLLLFIYQNSNLNSEAYYTYLRHLDNKLFCTTSGDHLVQRTRALMGDCWSPSEPNYDEELNNNKGVGFAHYWFYKLEFILWYQCRDDFKHWSNFRFTAKNSVEHISPQSPTNRDGDKVDKMMNQFGNLALVSRSMNSEFSNKPFNEKKEKFNNKTRALERPDSLKLELVYRNPKWSDDLAKRHQDKMIELYNRYFEDVEQSTCKLLYTREV